MRKTFIFGVVSDMDLNSMTEHGKIMTSEGYNSYKYKIKNKIFSNLPSTTKDIPI